MSPFNFATFKQRHVQMKTRRVSRINYQEFDNTGKQIIIKEPPANISEFITLKTDILSINEEIKDFIDENQVMSICEKDIEDAISSMMQLLVRS